MSRISLLPILLLLTLFSGCASEPVSAPVRELISSARQHAAAPVGFYRIQHGDTLYKIAFEFGLDIRDLASWNDLSDPGFIRSGNLLRLSPQKSTSISGSLANKPPVETRGSKVDATPAEHDADAAPPVWNWPSRGTLLSRFGDGLNKGIDIGGVRGNSILAAASGKIVYAGSGLRGYGKLIIIRHSKSLLSAYAHNARLLVSEGQIVERGQMISEMGDSDADRVKVHFQIREHGKPVDPMNFLPKQS